MLPLFLLLLCLLPLFAAVQVYTLHGAEHFRDPLAILREIGVVFACAVQKHQSQQRIALIPGHRVLPDGETHLTVQRQHIHGRRFFRLPHRQRAVQPIPVRPVFSRPVLPHLRKAGQHTAVITRRIVRPFCQQRLQLFVHLRLEGFIGGLVDTGAAVPAAAHQLVQVTVVEIGCPLAALPRGKPLGLDDHHILRQTAAETENVGGNRHRDFPLTAGHAVAQIVAGLGFRDLVCRRVIQRLPHLRRACGGQLAAAKGNLCHLVLLQSGHKGRRGAEIRVYRRFIYLFRLRCAVRAAASQQRQQQSRQQRYSFLSHKASSIAASISLAHSQSSSNSVQ